MGSAVTFGIVSSFEMDSLDRVCNTYDQPRGIHVPHISTERGHCSRRLGFEYYGDEEDG